MSVIEIVVPKISIVTKERTLKTRVLEFLAIALQDVRDAPRGEQVLRFRAAEGHGDCADVQCRVCVQIAGSVLRELQWVQNDAFGVGVFVASEETRRKRAEKCAEWTEEIVQRHHEDDSKGLPDDLYELVYADLVKRGKPVPKHKPKSTKGASGTTQQRMSN